LLDLSVKVTASKAMPDVGVPEKSATGMAGVAVTGGSLGFFL
jgi:hypothetical protein